MSHPHLTFHSVDAEGDPYPLWLRVLKGARGCYVIRDAKTRRVLYVGSSRNKLYSTITRHLQTWRRNKKWWSGSYGVGGHDPGVTFKRKDVQIAVIVMTHSMDHLAEEARLIEELKPKENLVEHPDGGHDDHVPF